MQQKIKTKANAFTLLELLVVISIIGILIALGAAAYSTAQKKGRDARRMSDIRALQNGFEQFYAKNGAYPNGLSEANSDLTIFPAGIPTDPRDPSAYVTASESSTTKYCVCALLENSTGNATGATGSGDAIACAYGTGDYYCLSNLQ